MYVLVQFRRYTLYIGKYCREPLLKFLRCLYYQKKNKINCVLLFFVCVVCKRTDPYMYTYNFLHLVIFVGLLYKYYVLTQAGLNVLAKPGVEYLIHSYHARCTYVIALIPCFCVCVFTHTDRTSRKGDVHMYRYYVNFRSEPR